MWLVKCRETCGIVCMCLMLWCGVGIVCWFCDVWSKCRDTCVVLCMYHEMSALVWSGYDAKGYRCGCVHASDAFGVVGSALVVEGCALWVCWCTIV